jgi:ATP-binding cassette subfamily A (ABC1) protein 3
MVPEAALLSDVSAEVAFQLPISAAPKFKDLFEGLDSRLKDFNIQTYGISITTLEEVFLKIAEGDSTNRRKTTMIKNKTEMNEEPKEVDDFDLSSVRINSGLKLFFVHFWALVIKKATYFKRDKKG